MGDKEHLNNAIMIGTLGLGAIWVLFRTGVINPDLPIPTPDPDPIPDPDPDPDPEPDPLLPLIIRVIDSRYNAVSGAEVRVVNMLETVDEQGVTGHDGRASFMVPTDTYRVFVVYAGIETMRWVSFYEATEITIQLDFYVPW